MKDYLVNVTDDNLDWLEDIPIECSYIEIDAYISDEIIDISDNVYVPPVKAEGRWFLVFIHYGFEPPTTMMQYVKSKGNRDTGLFLPDEITSLSEVWSGMKIYKL